MIDRELSKRDLLAVVATAAGGCAGRPEMDSTDTTRPRASKTTAGTAELCHNAFGTETVSEFGGSEACPDAEILSVASEPRPDSPTAAGRTASEFVDYVIVAYELTGDETRTLEGCVDAVGDQHSFRREVTPSSDRQEIEVGPFEHLGVNRIAVRFAGCQEAYRGP